MIPVGYMAKRVVKKPEWLKASNVADIYSVSSCCSEILLITSTTGNTMGTGFLTRPKSYGPSPKSTQSH